MKKIAKVQSWVPPVNVIRESAHGAGALSEKKNPKKGLGFFARSQTKAHILRDQLAPVVEQEEEDEDEVFMEQKGEDLECDHDSDYASDCDDEVSSECSDLDEEEHYKMSNENFKHHENRGKIYGRSGLYIERCQCDILLCKSTAPLSSKIIFLFEICPKIMHN